MVNGFDTSGNFILSECPAGSSGCSTVTLSGGTVYYPGMVQWSSVNQSWVVGDQLCAKYYNLVPLLVYRFGVRGNDHGLDRP